MIYTPQKRLAMYVRDLLVQPEGSVVVLGRNNIDRNDLTSLRIAIDTLGNARRLNSAKKYDGGVEAMSHAQQWSQPCTINFYGNGAYEQAQRLMLLARSQTAFELQRDSGITVFLASSLTDVKLLTGEDFSSRYELQCNVQFTESLTETVLRIDEAQFTIIED